ncbi:hypothetical protein PIB30_001773 [Stylosanthes scabra]|uniref:RRM domain-containing protein n=1 Tax=Stylosanthes scabra TaxID=79078 RepID=A0ABU6V4T4_9FABA|nr:hypothetical protein [Stylosanthes scabra]
MEHEDGETEGGDWQIYTSRRKGHGVRSAERRTSSNDVHWKWVRLENSSHSVFVENLPDNVTKGLLYRVFGRLGNIVDIFISRRVKGGKRKTFAFVRFDARGEAVRAVQTMNGVFIGMRKIFSRTKKEGSRLREWPVERGEQRKEEKGSFNMNTLKGHARKDLDEVRREPQSVELPKESSLEKIRKCIEVEPCQMQTDSLRRSLVGECKKEIVMERVTRRLREEWKGPGQIEWSDIGPNMCLLTFDSEEYMEIAKESSLLLSLFEELRSEWRFL